MKKFRFPLEKLRAWKQTRFEAETSKLEAMVENRRNLIARRETLTAEEREVLRCLRSRSILGVEELQAADGFRRWTERESLKLLEAERNLTVRIAEQRNVVFEARRQVETLDRLREKRLNQWRAEADRETENLVAELVVARWGGAGNF